MSQLEFLITLLSIIVGLGLADLARGIRNLVRPRQSVRWHWLPIAWVILTFLLVANFWWGYFEGLQLEVWRNYFAFLVLLGEVIALYLMCAFALPDLKWEDPAHGTAVSSAPAAVPDTLDLEAFHFSKDHRRWFFGVIIVLLAFVEVTETIEQAATETAAWDVGEALRLTFAGCAALLLATDREWVHSLITAGLLAGFVFFIARFALNLE
jgi:hypothetical protein